MERLLVVNADDFGQSEGVNRGVIEAAERGVVTSASLMVRWPAARSAARYARRSRLSAGLHVDLGEWRWAAGTWEPTYLVAAPDDPAAVEREIRRQLAIFRAEVGADPTHLDSHQHVHQRAPASSIVARIAQELGVPLRGVTPGVRYCGGFYGQTAEGAPLPGWISVERFVTLLDALEPGPTELGCHPGFADDLDAAYRAERAREVAVLCDPRVRRAIAHRAITLATFRELRSLPEGGDAGAE